jgi:hypothetical protein
MIGCVVDRNVTAFGQAEFCYEHCKSNPVTGLDRPLGFQEGEAPRFLENRHVKVVRFSDLLTGRVYPSGNSPGTHFC